MIRNRIYSFELVVGKSLKIKQSINQEREYTKSLGYGINRKQNKIAGINPTISIIQ